MRQNNNNSINKNNASSKKKNEKIDDWRNEHGQPDFEFLQSLVNDGSIEALEKLKFIAEDLDVEFDPNSPPEELIDRIRSVVAQNSYDGFQPLA